MIEVVCHGCGEAFNAQRRNAKWCSTRCRKQGNRAGSLPADVVSIASLSVPDFVPVEGESDFVTIVRRTLHRAERIDTFLGQMAIELARATQSTKDTGSAKAALMKQVREVMAEALAGTTVEVDALDELEARRQEKLAGLGA